MRRQRKRKAAVEIRSLRRRRRGVGEVGCARQKFLLCRADAQHMHTHACTHSKASSVCAHTQGSHPLWGPIVQGQHRWQNKGYHAIRFSFLLSSTQLNFNHTKLLTRKGHLCHYLRIMIKQERSVTVNKGLSPQCYALFSSLHSVLYCAHYYLWGSTICEQLYL